ncbi:MAG: hypothetical protein HZA54_09245, partial [Planctomycetes bacterium]|nr:hypothetical protein [Planctomycetota bacterium]
GSAAGAGAEAGRRRASAEAPLGATPVRAQAPIVPGEFAAAAVASGGVAGSPAAARRPLPKPVVAALFAGFLVLVLFASKWVGGRIAEQVLGPAPIAR